MSKLFDTKVLSFRRFERADAETEVTYDIAWPVEVIECYANKVTDGELDALAETVLELLTVPEMSYRKIASLLMVSEEVVKRILASLEGKGYYEEKKVTEKGKEYNYDVYVREYNAIKNYKEKEIQRYMVRHKYLSEEEQEYQFNAINGL